MSTVQLDALGEVAVVVFAKTPRAGRVKTRLGEAIGDERAASVYRCFLEDIAEQVGRLEEALERGVSPVLAYAGDPGHAGFEPFRRAQFAFVEQRGAGLGARLSTVVEGCFSAGANTVLIIGTDSPTLLPRHFRAALDGLERSDLVVGPSFDGGYYLIGLRERHTLVFEDIDWSTAAVFGQTLRRCRAAGLLCESLEFWYDVDTFHDLKLLQTHLIDYLRHREPRIASRTAQFIARLDEQGVLDARSMDDD